eukprot:7572668-Lingulodinium_polyedra.AAC.1
MALFVIPRMGGLVCLLATPQCVQQFGEDSRVMRMLSQLGWLQEAPVDAGIQSGLACCEQRRSM